MSCHVLQPTEFYDLKELKRQNHRLDRLVDIVVNRNAHRLQQYGAKSSWLDGYKNITEDLVRDFRAEAVAFMKQVQSSKLEYGYLYKIIEDKDLMDFSVFLRWEEFPLIQGQVFHEVHQIAKTFAEPETEHYDATMLYLLIFFSLLVNNQHANWIAIEYLTKCNKDHQYALHVNWAVTS